MKKLFSSNIPQLITIKCHSHLVMHHSVPLLNFDTVLLNYSISDVLS